MLFDDSNLFFEFYYVYPVNRDTISVQQKQHYLDLYLQKARKENNLLEEYRALDKRSYLVSFDEAVRILHSMNPVVQNLKNDSITGAFYNRSTVLYYKHRYFDEALNYAIQSAAFNEKTGNHYNLNSVRIIIGNIYYHTRHYEKAEEYFTKAKDFYKTSSAYDYRRGHIVVLYSLGKTFLELKKTAELKNVIAESEAIMPQLNPRHRRLETAYTRN